MTLMINIINPTKVQNSLSILVFPKTIVLDMLHNLKLMMTDQEFLSQGDTYPQTFCVHEQNYPTPTLVYPQLWSQELSTLLIACQYYNNMDTSIMQQGKHSPPQASKFLQTISPSFIQLETPPRNPS